MLMLSGFIEDTVRGMLFFLDKTIYKLIPVIYNFVQILARQELLTQENIKTFANNVYALLAIFMLFRLAFVLLNAIIDPDKLTNKEKGFGNIMTRFITGMFLIVVIPWAFGYAFDLQNMILSKNLMTKIVFGADSRESDTAGYTLAKTTLSAFYYCDDPDVPQDTVPPDQPVPCELDYGYTLAFSAENSLRKQGWSSLKDNLNKTESGDYKYNYSAGISTACGIVILLMLLTLSIDVAVRVVKLAFLQLITPVAVVGYIEPGGKRFKEWLKITTSTYLNLFIRLLALSIAAYIIALIDPNNFTPRDIEGKIITSFMLSSFVRVFIIIGCLLFVKEGPKMLSDILGIKDAGLGGLNPFKKLGGVPLIGGAAAAGAAALAFRPTAGLLGGVAGGIAAKRKGGNFLAGAGQGMLQGAKNVNLKDVTSGAIGKSIKNSTIGAWDKGRNYAAGKVTGKEEKLGVFNDIKKSMASTANEMHLKAVNENDKKRWVGKEGQPETGLKFGTSKKNGYSAYSENYRKQLKAIDKAKEQISQRENARSYWANLYQNDLTGTYKDASGVTHEFRDSYEKANDNYITAQKMLESEKAALERMNKQDAYKQDAEIKEFANRMSAIDTAKELDSKMKSIENIATNPSTSNQANKTSNFTVDNGEVKTKSGITMPGGYNPNDPRNK